MPWQECEVLGIKGEWWGLHETYAGLGDHAQTGDRVCTGMAWTVSTVRRFFRLFVRFGAELYLLVVKYVRVS